MLNKGKIKVAIQSKVLFMTKRIMQTDRCNVETAYKRFISTHLYELLADKDTGLYLEPINYIVHAYELEKDVSKEAMIEFITTDL